MSAMSQSTETTTADAKQTPQSDPTLCGVCQAKPHKYKCPTCRACRYCSKECFKKHKDDGCGTDANKTSSQPAPPSNPPQLQEDEHQPILTAAHLKLLAASPAVTGPIQHAKLQDLIRTIDSSEQPQKLLEHHISTNPEFAQFVDAILVALGARDPAPEIKPPSLLDNVRALLEQGQ